MTMCTVQRNSRSNPGKLQSQHDMDSTDIDRVMQTLLSPRRSHLQRRVPKSRCFGSMQENLKSVEHRNSLKGGLRFFSAQNGRSEVEWPSFALNGHAIIP